MNTEFYLIIFLHLLQGSYDNFTFNLLMWFIILIDFLIFTQLCLPRIFPNLSQYVLFPTHY